MYDLAIIGAGPAGATLARAIGQKYKALLVDKKENPAAGYFHGKCCGGLLAPDAQKLLARMGVALPREALVGPQIFAVRAIDLSSGRERFYQRFYINIDRGKFERWLISLVPPFVEKSSAAGLRALSRREAVTVCISTITAAGKCSGPGW